MSGGDRLKWLLRERDKRAGSLADSLPLLSVSIEWGVRRRDESAINQAASEDLSKYKLVRKHDLVLNRMRAFQGALGLAPEDGLVSPDYAVLECREAVDPAWLSATMRSTPMIAEMASRIRGIGGVESAQVRTPRINVQDLLDIRLDVPPLAQQRVVADFLDRETIQIDALIEAQRDLVARLKERRATLIADAVLVGEDPLHLPREPRVPFAPLGFGFSVTLGKMLDGGRTRGAADSDLPYLRAANVQDAGLALDDVKSMPFSPTEARMLDLRAGDVLVVEGGAVGTSLVLDEDMPGWSFQKTVNRLRRTGGWEPKFASYVLQTYRDTGVIDAICNRSTIPHLTAEKLRSVQVPAPDLHRQRDIVRQLDLMTARIDVTVEAAHDAIALMQERRSALISAAVTGRIDPLTGRKPVSGKVQEFA